MTELDDFDRSLLAALRGDCTQAVGALARELGVSQPVAWRRVKRLYDLGVIKARRVYLDHDKLGFGVTVFLGLSWPVKAGSALKISNAR